MLVSTRTTLKNTDLVKECVKSCLDKADEFDIRVLKKQVQIYQTYGWGYDKLTNVKNLLDYIEHRSFYTDGITSFCVEQDVSGLNVKCLDGLNNYQ